MDEEEWEKLVAEEVANLEKFERERRTPYLTSYERLGRKRGRIEGRIQGRADILLYLLNARFTSILPRVLEDTIRGTLDLYQLVCWVDLALEAGSLEEFRRQAQI